jgi:hypothetical protein
MGCTLPYLLVGMILLSACYSSGLPRVTEEKNGGATYLQCSFIVTLEALTILVAYPLAQLLSY